MKGLQRITLLFTTLFPGVVECHHWAGKKAVVNYHKEVPFHLLRCNAELSAGEPESGNLLVQGDNLIALKALLPHYAGQVKCIYIDPPYNTGVDERDERAASDPAGYITTTSAALRSGTGFSGLSGRKPKTCRTMTSGCA
ncbi:site-specific DNA-methyltransferase [Chlorobaculum sp. MV4-Y]|uniref:site-specific DNA-methyltransferase n=1 Tax=Chlorobaculum sp. MV4-Y TaxID=2976335 RepID=UPI0021AFC5BD|nr:site-specific DNA-methyltransferase [Chlorobaculum sp. MV4-Y]UWX57561.1 site-specific DNA-methyltransferase [Chlorobaculum sp. MV4-Y]